MSGLPRRMPGALLGELLVEPYAVTQVIDLAGRVPPRGGLEERDGEPGSASDWVAPSLRHHLRLLRLFATSGRPAPTVSCPSACWAFCQNGPLACEKSAVPDSRPGSAGGWPGRRGPGVTNGPGGDKSRRRDPPAVRSAASPRRGP